MKPDVRQVWSEIRRSSRLRQRSITLPDGFREVAFDELIDHFASDVPTLGSDLVDAVIPTADGSEKNAIAMIASLEAKGLISFAISPRNQPALFIGRDEWFGELGTTGEYRAAHAMLAHFDGGGEFDPTTGVVRRNVTVEQWSDRSKDSIAAIAAEARLSKQVVIGVLKVFEREGWTNILNAEKDPNGAGYVISVEVPDAKQLTYAERAVVEALRKLYGVVDNSKISNLMSPVTYATAEYMRAAEAQYKTLALSERMLAKAKSDPSSVSKAIGSTYVTVDNFERDAEIDIRMLRAAETYCWFGDPTLAVAAAAASLPDTIKCGREMTEGHAGWWYFVKPIEIQTSNNSTELRAMAWEWATIIERSPDFPDLEVERFGLLAQGYVGDERFGDSLIATCRFFWREGFSIERMIADNERAYFAKYRDTQAGLVLERTRLAIDYMARFFASGAAWLKQRVIVETRHPVERHYRKRVQREMKIANVPEVRIIQLRRKQTVREAAPGSDKAVDWKGRWLVSGHWRMQPYKSTGRVEAIWIDSYVKGPDDKPFIESTTKTKRIFAVKR